MSTRWSCLSLITTQFQADHRWCFHCLFQSTMLLISYYFYCIYCWVTWIVITGSLDSNIFCPLSEVLLIIYLIYVFYCNYFVFRSVAFSGGDCITGAAPLIWHVKRRFLILTNFLNYGYVADRSRTEALVCCEQPLTQTSMRKKVRTEVYWSCSKTVMGTRKKCQNKTC